MALQGQHITTTSRRRVVAAAGVLGLCGIAVAVLAHGRALTLRDAERAALTGRAAAVHAELERLESAVPAGRALGDARWQAHLRVLDEQLEHGHVDVAVRAGHDAYVTALESRTWESMIA